MENWETRCFLDKYTGSSIVFDFNYENHLVNAGAYVLRTILNTWNYFDTCNYCFQMFLATLVTSLKRHFNRHHNRRRFDLLHCSSITSCVELEISQTSMELAIKCSRYGWSVQHRRPFTWSTLGRQRRDATSARASSPQMTWHTLSPSLWPAKKVLRWR